MRRKKNKIGGEGRNRADDGAFAELCLSHLATPPWEARKVNKARLQVNDGGSELSGGHAKSSARSLLKTRWGNRGSVRETASAFFR